MNAIMSARRSAPRAVGVCLAAACVVLIPRLAIAADTGGGTTYRAQIGPDGAVKSVKQVSVDGSTSSFSGALPVTMKITHTAAGAAQTFTYHIENTFSQTQTIHFDDTAGIPHQTSVVVQLPLVAQLGVNVPKSMGAITATNASVTEGIDGTRHVLWNLVLFTPVGSAIQDITMTTAANGTPVAELAAATVDPNSAQGLSVATQNATANYQQDDFWAGFLSGANGGLGQLATGTGKLISGMQQILGGISQLHSGFAGGLPGTKKLDAGGQQLYAGSKQLFAGGQQLHAGIGKAAAGAGALDSGLKQIHTGLGNTPAGLTGGLKAIHKGSSDLTNGLGQVSGGLDSLSTGLDALNTGAGQLSTGVGQIDAGLNQLADPTTGLPSAVAGINELIAGTQALVAGIGSDGDATTLLGGVTAIQGGLSQLKTGIQQNAGCGADILGKLLSGVGAPVADPCATGGTFPPVVAISDPTTIAILTGMVTQFTAVANGTDPTLQAGFGQLSGGLQQIHDGLSHPAGAGGPSDLGGVKEGVQAVEGGLNQLLTGVSAASTGVTQLAAGADTAAAGASQLATGAASADTGGQQLDAGAAQAFAGSKKLTDGTAAALTGSQQLLAGTGAALSGTNKLFLGLQVAHTGSGALTAGLKKSRDGLKLVSGGIHTSATSLPAAVSGLKQLLDGQTQAIGGAQQIESGIGQVKSGATGPLASQLAQASQNAHKQLAVLQAASNLGSAGPGGAGASYVLSQASNAFGLTATTTAAKHGSSHTGRNVGIGLGGAALLLAGIGGGFAMGRTRRRAHAA